MRTAKTLGLLAYGILILGWDHYSAEMLKEGRWRTPWGFVAHITLSAFKANRYYRFK